MTTAPISTQIIPRQSSTLQESPLTIIMAIPRTDFVPAGNVLIPVVDFPVGQLTEITAANVAMLGAVPGANPGTDTAMARAAYDFIEAGANVHVFALPFEALTADTQAQRSTKVASALSTILGSPVQRKKLPNATADVVLVPRETVDGTAAHPVVTALETVCAPSHGIGGAVALVDAGGIVGLANNDRSAGGNRSHQRQRPAVGSQQPRPVHLPRQQPG